MLTVNDRLHLAAFACFQDAVTKRLPEQHDAMPEQH
jgi:hypothetical protein